jgi:hypothetical protein
MTPQVIHRPAGGAATFGGDQSEGRRGGTLSPGCGAVGGAAWRTDPYCILSKGGATPGTATLGAGGMGAAGRGRNVPPPAPPKPLTSPVCAVGTAALPLPCGVDGAMMVGGLAVGRGAVLYGLAAPKGIGEVGMYERKPPGAIGPWTRYSPRISERSRPERTTS